MMNNLFNAIVIVALLGTFLLAPTPQPAPLSLASRPPPESIAVAPAIDGTAARAAIEASGYSEVSPLTKAADGTWRARAYFGKAEVRLVVDAKGKVLPD
jgi:hypothetical protein